MKTTMGMIRVFLPWALLLRCLGSLMAHDPIKLVSSPRSFHMSYQQSLPESAPVFYGVLISFSLQTCGKDYYVINILLAFVVPSVGHSYLSSNAQCIAVRQVGEA